MKPILVADNDPLWVKTLSEIITGAGYSVISATNPKEAMAIIGNHEADLAVVDLRLEQDSDKEDFSGLHVAEDTDRTVPKIIVSNFGTIAAAVEGLKIDPEGLPGIIDFIEKERVKTRLIPSIRRAIKLKKILLSVADSKITAQLNKDHADARKDAKLHYITSLVLSVVFVVPIVWGVFMLHIQPSLSILYALVGVVVAQVTHHLFNRNLEFLYRRVDRFHAELLQTNRFERLLEAASEFDDPQSREQYKRLLIRAAGTQWLLPEKSESSLSADEDQSKSHNVDSPVM